MKFLSFLLCFVIAGNMQAKEAKVKIRTLDINAHIKSVMLEKENVYRVDLVEFAAVYKTSENEFPCLQKGMRENSLKALTVNVDTLEILKCK